MADNEYTINILNADELYVEGKRIQQLDLGTLVEKVDGIGIGINNSFPRIIFDISGTDGIRLPTGTNSQRPLTTLYDDISDFEGPDKLTGVIRFNSEKHKYEGWTGLNTIHNIGVNNASWGSFVQEDNDNARVKFSTDIHNIEMHEFYIHTIKDWYTFIGHNLGDYSQSLNDWTNRAKGPPSYMSFYGGENTESYINFHTSTMATGQAAGSSLGVTQRMRITSNGHIAIGDNFTNATSRLTIKGEDKFPLYSANAVNKFGNAFNGVDGYGQIRVVASTNDNVHLDIGTSTSVGSASIGGSGQTASYLQSQSGNSATNILLQPTGGNVGIGTIEPEYKLDLDGDIRLGGTKSLSEYNPRIVFSESSGGVEDFYLQYVGSEGGGASGNRFRIGSGNSGWNSEALTVVGNGRIGMGRTNPYTKLHVKDNGGVLSLEGSDHCYINIYRSGGSRTGWFGNGGGTAMYFQNEESSGPIYLNTNNGLIYSNSTMQINWRNSAGILNLGDQYHGIRSDSGQGVTINTYGVSNGIHLQQSTGRVGIGTRSPGYRFQVQGNGYFTDGLRVYGSTNNASGSDAVLWIGKNDNDDWSIMLDHSHREYGIDINGAGNYMIRFRHYGSSKARFNSEGQLERYASNAGYLVGSYNWGGSNSYYANPIYTIGTSYRPSTTSLGAMYGIGYSYIGNASFLSGLHSYQYRSGWGMYVAADGDARIFFNGSNGDISNYGQIKSGGDIYSRGSLRTDGQCYVYGGWLRTRNTYGWYNETYAGGWYMNNSAWVKSYSKPIYISNYRSEYIGGTFDYADGNEYENYYEYYRNLRYKYFSWPVYDSLIDYYWTTTRYFSVYGWDRHSNEYHNIGLRVTQGIWCGKIIVNSDKRIKKDIEEVPDEKALDIVRKIDCVYYNYIDDSKNTKDKVIGFIAQQVKEHFPNAVDMTKEVIPNINQAIKKFKVYACTREGKILNPSVVGNVNESVNIEKNVIYYQDLTRDSEKYSTSCEKRCNVEDCYAYDQDPANYFKVTILDNYKFAKNKGYQFKCYTEINDKSYEKVLTVNRMETEKNSFIIDVFPTNILYIGEEVEDFHTLDKDRIFALNFSATQQLDKNQRSQIEKVKKLETKVTSQKQTIENLTAELRDLKQLLREKNII